MSRAAIIVALREVLERQPTPEEYERARVSLASCAHRGRIYVPTRAEVQPGLFNDIRDMKRNGWSIRRIAREKKMSKSQVALVLRATCPILGVEAGQQPLEPVIPEGAQRSD